MKKLTVFFTSFALLYGVAAFTQTADESLSKVIDVVTSGATNTTYIGTTRVFIASGASITNAQWHIKRIVAVSNQTVSIAEGYSGVGRGNDQLWNNIWTNRATTNITYKAAQ